MRLLEQGQAILVLAIPMQAILPQAILVQAIPRVWF